MNKRLVIACLFVVTGTAGYSLAQRGGAEAGDNLQWGD
jgi:hypothetical protein